MQTITWLIQGFLWGKGTPFDGGDKVYMFCALRIQTGFLSSKIGIYRKNSVGENIREHGGPSYTMLVSFNSMCGSRGGGGTGGPDPL